MKKLIYCLALISIIFPAFAQAEEKAPQGAGELVLRNIVSIVLEHNPQVSNTKGALNYNYHLYRSVNADKKPQIGFSTNYGINYTTKRQYLSVTYEDETTQSLYTDLYLKQLLPSFSNLVFGINNTISRWAVGETNTTFEFPRYSQAPSIYISLDQPVFVNGKFIDGRIYSANFRRSEIAYLSAAQNHRYTRNSAIYNTLGLAFEVINLRNIISSQEKAIEIREQSIERLNRNLAKGLIPETEIWEMRIELGKNKEVLLQTKHYLYNTENTLRQALGFEQEQELIIVENIADTLIGENLDLEADDILNNNPNIKMKELNYEESKLTKIMNGLNSASAWKTSLSFSPRYAYERSIDSSAKSLISSFEDFTAGKAGLDFTFTIGLDISSHTGKKWQEIEEADRENEKMTAEILFLEKKNLLMTFKSFLQRKENLKSSIALLEDNIKLKEKQVSIEKKLLDLGEASEIDVVEMEIEYLDKVNELKKAKMDLFLNQLDILCLTRKDLGELILKSL